MATLLKLHLGVVLKHVLDLQPVIQVDDDEDSDELEEADESNTNHIVGSVMSGPSAGRVGARMTRRRSEDVMSLADGRISSRPPQDKARPQTAISEAKREGVGGSRDQWRAKLDLYTPKKNSKTRKRSRIQLAEDPYGADLLDFIGPELIHGARSFLLFHKICGQVNWTGLPLWFSILYKTAIIGCSYYIVGYRLGERFYSMNVINENYRNPIFMFISCIAVITCISQNIITFRTNLCDLCPMYKILTTPRLCFIKIQVQHLLGSQSLGLILLSMVYNGLLLCLLMYKGLDDFVNSFSMPLFMLEIFASTVASFTFIGTALIDLYIRSAFGHWLLALKSHLENRFMYFHRSQKRLRLAAHDSHSTTRPIMMNRETSKSGRMSVATNPFDNISFSSGNSVELPINFISLDEIQRNLNNMDDHLEVLRSVQVGCLVHITLNAFLANGALFLLAYHLLANQSNFYHGFILLLLSVNSIVLIFACYSGDRWIYYALSSFVQTVEDEYFMQNDVKLMTTPSSQTTIDGATTNQNASHTSTTPPQKPRLTASGCEASAAETSHQNKAALINHLLLIRKKDVLFCREFLHQFENHLSTPWSELTVKAHLHMLRTFVTLVAAQIIFDHEH